MNRLEANCGRCEQYTAHAGIVFVYCPFPDFWGQGLGERLVKLDVQGASVPFSNRMHGFQNSTCKLKMTD